MDDSQGLRQINSDASVEPSVLIKPKKRVITAARKEQNRIAQRAYRRRRREQKTILQKGPVSSGARRIEPRQDSPEGVLATLDTHSRRGVELDSPIPVADPSCTEVIETHTHINPARQHIGYNVQDVDLQDALNRLSVPVTLPSGVTSSVSGPTQATTSDETGPYPPGLINVLLNISGGLEDNRTAVFKACLSNAICIGIDLAQLMFCEQPCMSPFYQPMARANEDPAALVAASSHDSMPVSLKPTLAQILIPHHASIDLIPIPRLRERAILMTAALPHLFSLWEMKLDIYTRDALMCRGRNTMSGFISQPWDMRSWQAEPWFLEKWRMVVDADGVNSSPSMPGIPGLWM
ncbi:hypothetical protein F5Y19DRAFT_468596 [Xylariaceae sp. FL1651]|nr:hypothetical protein F5Y19DRAFT_468596 [Xylariaceae sp. FL1651]